MTTTTDNSAGMLIARLDRIPVWSLPGLFVGIIGVGFLFTFYDIFDINVSFIQTCTQIVPACTPPSASNYIGLPVLFNLVGYVIGTLILGPLADRAGRRDLLLVTMVITGVGSVLTAVIDNYTWFVIARAITGIGIGADLAIVNTYINEMAPRKGRARYTALIFLFSALGAVLGIWLGLWLTTPATPLPLGLPFAVAGHGFEYGWRVMYLIGGLLALVGVLLRFQLPESARWLIARGRHEAAAEVVDMMERRASMRTFVAAGPTARRRAHRDRHAALFRDSRRSDVSRAYLRALCHVVLRLHHALFLRGRSHDNSRFTALSAARGWADRRRWDFRFRPLCRRGLCLWRTDGTKGMAAGIRGADPHRRRHHRHCRAQDRAERCRFGHPLFRLQPMGPDRLQLDNREFPDPGANHRIRFG